MFILHGKGPNFRTFYYVNTQKDIIFKVLERNTDYQTLQI